MKAIIIQVTAARVDFASVERGPISPTALANAVAPSFCVWRLTIIRGIWSRFGDSAHTTYAPSSPGLWIRGLYRDGIQVASEFMRIQGGAA